MRQSTGSGAWGISHLRGAVLAFVVACATALGTGVVSAEPVGFRPPDVPTYAAPPQSDHLAAAWYQKSHPNAVPSGTNDFTCVPSAAHPHPVVLAHGTDSSAYSDWSGIAPRLTAAGFCVFAMNYGGKPGAESYGTEDLVLSAYQIGAFVDQVLAATRADKVDLVGFSQGANVTRYYVNKLGGAPEVDQWVGLASPSYGGVMYGLVPVAQAIPGALQAFAAVTSLAAVQQAEGSPIMLALNAGGDTVPGVRYVTIGSRVDEMIQPFENIALRGPGARNLALQDLCPADLTGHFHMVYDPFVQELLLTVLDPGSPAPVCRAVPLGTGIPEVIIAGNS
ncbi:alpha/beta fold hydrolase [Nocardia abscessus]|uniref:esterase/lipase family protein n=1 Tax=Nocardia abscessus TaxID=120957 RepID=UPI001895B339|nr:alpha/beta fold hydrolase [Nocardia abscessus]MBF6335572.1 alpha/beta fold hydrolase [Nocardia abscessus]